MMRFDAIILAAGLSLRMGAQNKLLLDWHGVPIIRRVVQTYLDCIGPNITVVTGFESDLVIKALNGLPVQFHHNPCFADGQQSSVMAGLSVPSDADATLMGLGDQPLLTASALCDLMTAYQIADTSKIAFAVRGDERGNPTIIPAPMRSLIAADKARPGCRKFINDNPHLVTRIPMQSDGFFTDIDTPESYAFHVRTPVLGRIKRLFSLSPDQADQLARIKFPCC